MSSLLRRKNWSTKKLQRPLSTWHRMVLWTWCKASVQLYQQLRSTRISCLFQMERLFSQFQRFFCCCCYNGRAINLLKNWILETVTALTTALSAVPLRENSLRWWNCRHFEGEAHCIANLLCFFAQSLPRYQCTLFILLQFNYSTLLRCSSFEQNPPCISPAE